MVFFQRSEVVVFQKCADSEHVSKLRGFRAVCSPFAGNVIKLAGCKRCFRK
jgi:hypothetical protein